MRKEGGKVGGGGGGKRGAQILEDVSNGEVRGIGRERNKKI